MGGELKYALNLTNAGFLGPLAQAATALTGFLGVTLSIGAGVSKVFEQITRGGALKDLSARTVESVSALVRLQHAFEQGGVSAESLRTVTFNLQRSLSGVSETGDATLDSFKALGTSIEKLRGMSTPQALLTIFEGINKLGKSDAAGAAGKIFGRGAAGDILQLARDSKDFKQALEDASNQAALFHRTADAFDRLGDTIGTIKFKLSGLFAGVAEGVTPALQAIADALGQIDFEGIGLKIGQAIRTGKIDDLVYLTIASGAERGARFLYTLLTDPSLWSGIGEAASRIWRDLERSLRDNKVLSAIVFGGFLNFGAAEAGGRGIQQLAKNGLISDAGGGVATGGVGGASPTVDHALTLIGSALSKAAGASGGPLSDQLQDLLDSLGVPGGGGPGGRRRGRGLGGGVLRGGGGGRAGDDADALRRIGAFAGDISSNPATEFAKRTADNTREIVRAQYRTNQLIERFESQQRSGFVNV